MTGVHLSHNGNRYFSLKARDEADKAHAKATFKGKGDRGRTANSRGGPIGDKQLTDAEWQTWMAKWPTPAPWHQPAAGSPAADGPPPADATSQEITRRLADGRFAFEATEDDRYEGVSCLKCHNDWHYKEMFCRLCNFCDAQFPEEVLSSRLKRLPFIEGEIDF